MSEHEVTSLLSFDDLLEDMTLTVPPLTGSPVGSESSNGTYVGGVDLGGDEEQEEEEPVPPSVRTLTPPPMDPPVAAPRTTTNNEMQITTIYDVLDVEAVQRGKVKAEAFVKLALIAKKMRFDALQTQKAAAERQQTTEKDLFIASGTIYETETDKRNNIIESEDIAWEGLRGVVGPLKDDIVEKVAVREKRVRRRERKLDELKQLHLTKAYEIEWEKEIVKERAESDWASHVQKMYSRGATRLRTAASLDMKAKIEAAETELFSTYPDTPFRTPVPVSTPPRSLTLHQSLLQKQLETSLNPALAFRARRC